MVLKANGESDEVPAGAPRKPAEDEERRVGQSWADRDRFLHVGSAEARVGFPPDAFSEPAHKVTEAMTRLLEAAIDAPDDDQAEVPDEELVVVR